MEAEHDDEEETMLWKAKEAVFDILEALQRTAARIGAPINAKERAYLFMQMTACELMHMKCAPEDVEKLFDDMMQAYRAVYETENGTSPLKAPA